LDAQSQTILEAVLKLPEVERAAIVERLLESLTADAEDVTDDEWRAEIDRRHEEAVRGEAGTIPWSELKKQT